MLKELKVIYNSSLQERLDKSIVSKLIGTKVKFGMGVKKKSLAEELHKPIRRKFKKCRVLVNGIAPPGWLSGERVQLMTWWLRVRSPVEATFLSGVFSPLTSAEACEKSSRWLWKEK